MANKGNIYSGDTSCLEINDGAKTRKHLGAGNQEVSSSNEQADSSSTISQSSQKITGVYFDDLDHVTFDPAIDPEPGSCFNCWKPGHSRKDCSKPKRQDFCHNCGRRDVRVTTCPRCSRAYVGYWKIPRKDRGRWAGEFYDDAAESIEVNEKIEQNKTENEETEYQVQPTGNDQDEGFSSTESEYCEDMVVDEEKRSLKFTGKFIEDFLNLLNAMKHLPIDTQTTVILRFVEDRREMMKEEGVLTIKIPSFRTIWNFLRAAGYYFYTFGRNFLSKFV